MTEMEYGMLSREGGSIFFERWALWSVESEGELLVEPKYTMLVSNGEGGFLATTTEYWDDEPDGVYWIDAAGNVSATGVKTMSGLEQVSSGVDAGAFGGKTDVWLSGRAGAVGHSPAADFRRRFFRGLRGRFPVHGLRPARSDGKLGGDPKYEYLNYEAGGLIWRRKTKRPSAYWTRPRSRKSLQSQEKNCIVRAGRARTGL